MSGAIVVQGNALKLPIPDESVDLIITSPPYFALRSYQDEGEHYAGQIGSEPTPQDFLEALWAATREMVRVLKPTGSIFVNLGDKYAGSGMGGNSNLTNSEKYLKDRAANYEEAKWTTHARAETTPAVKDGLSGQSHARTRTVRKELVRPKSLYGLPWRYAIGCIDQLGLILRAEVVWSKPNGLPESVTDRVRRSHEQWFMFTKQGRYFAAVDEIREPHTGGAHARRKDGADSPKNAAGLAGGVRNGYFPKTFENPLGKLPGSVWSIPSEPLLVPQWAKDKYDLPDHFAAFPTEWPRRLILGFSPSGVCVECGEGRRPVVEKQYRTDHFCKEDVRGKAGYAYDQSERPHGVASTEATITGYACACTPYTDHPGTAERHANTPPEGRHGNTATKATIGTVGGKDRVGPRREYHLEGWTPPDTRPVVVLDPFGGTGTVALVARTLDRVGISVDLSHDYCELSRWRIFESGHGDKAANRTNRERQGAFL